MKRRLTSEHSCWIQNLARMRYHNGLCRNTSFVLQEVCTLQLGGSMVLVWQQGRRNYGFDTSKLMNQPKALPKLAEPAPWKTIFFFLSSWGNKRFRIRHGGLPTGVPVPVLGDLVLKCAKSLVEKTYIQHQNIGYHVDIDRDASYLYHVTCVCCHMHVVGKSIWKIQNDVFHPTQKKC